MALRQPDGRVADVGDVLEEERRREFEEEEWRRRASLQQGRSGSTELMGEHGIAYGRPTSGELLTSEERVWQEGRGTLAASPTAAADATSNGDVDADDVESSKGQWGGKGTVMMEVVPPGQQMALSFEHLSAWVPIQVKPPSVAERAVKGIKNRGHRASAGDKPVTLQQKAQQQKEGKRQIMYDLSAVVRPGEVLALMGPSGSGKTSLLSVIGGRAAKAVEVSGSVTVNGMPLTKAFRRRIGFVLQDDVLYEDLTVRETLTYAAMLRLPRSMPKKEKIERVEKVIDALGLRKSANTIIGGFLRRGISGGERKRASIGHELIVNPAVMLLDEPTSGLDSTTALHLMILLQELADGGRAVCTTIHQPSSRLYQKLDRLMLLAEGHAMYYGPAMQVLDWFRPFGYEIPFGVSIPDYVLDLTMGEAGTSSSGNTGTAAVTQLYTAFQAYLGEHPEGFKAEPRSGARKRHQAALPISNSASEGSSGSPGSASDARLVLDANGHAAHPTAGKGGAAASAFAMGQGVQKGQMVAGQTAAAGGAGGAAKVPERWDGASWLQQVMILTSRAVRIRRFEQLTGQHFFTLFAVAFITGMVWWQRGTGYSVLAAQDTLGLLFFELLFPSFRALFHALFTLPNEYRMLLKERPSGLYKLSAYYIGRTMADVPVEMINTFLFVVIAYWFGGLKRTAGAFFANVAALLLVTLVAEAWGLMIGGACMNAKTAQTITTVIMLAFLLVGGFYVKSIPVWIGWIKYLSFLYWGYNLLIKIQFRDAQYYNCTGIASDNPISQAEAAVTQACTPVASTQAALGLPTNPEDSAWPEVLVLLGFMVVLRIATYYVLRHKTATRFAAGNDAAAGKGKGKHKA